MPEAIFSMKLGEYFFCEESEFMQQIQAFGKKQGIADGTPVKLEYSHSNHKIDVRLNWEAPTNAQQGAIAGG